jgi:hypothetical protein
LGDRYLCRNAIAKAMKHIPATGWLFNNQGEVKLVNQVSPSDAYSIAAHHPACLTHESEVISAS